MTWIRNIEQKLSCPSCKGKLGIKDETSILCDSCAACFEILSPNSAHLIAEAGINKNKSKIQTFWGDLCRQWYTEQDKTLTREELVDLLSDLETMFRERNHLAVMEMDLSNLSGKDILEIGSGGGAHSALFKHYGGNMISVDITPERVASTALKLSLLERESGVALAADAENLPFNDNSFDIVYSNGVLHHSENTDKCISEVYRVLKPGGLAVIMLYSRNSVFYWCNYFLRALFTGLYFKLPEAEWLGILTEGKPKFNSEKNPYTRVYSRAEMKQAFRNFHIISLRKASFTFHHFPLMGRIRDFLFRLCKIEPYKSGTIVYGAPYYPEAKLELMIGKHFGFDWNLKARKP